MRESMKRVVQFLGFVAAAVALFAVFASGAPDARASAPPSSMVCSSTGQGQLQCTWASPWQPLAVGDATVIAPNPFFDDVVGQKVAWTVDVHLSTPTGSDMGTIRRFFPGHVVDSGGVPGFQNDNGTTSDVSIWSYIGVGLDASTATAAWLPTWLTLADGGDAGPGPAGPSVTVTCNTTACSAATVFTIQYQRPVNDSGT